MNALQSVMGDRPQPYIMAHRGNSELCPENTMPAFERALQDGCDIIETDLHVSADGVFMCIHDATLDRTTNGTGSVRHLTQAQLQSLTASYNYADYPTAIIPTLRSVLEMLPSDVAITLELKSDDFLKPDVCVALASLLEDTGTANRAAILSFSRERLHAIQKNTRLPVGLITMYGLQPEAEWQMVGVYWPFMFLNPFYARIANRRGQLVCPLDPTPDSRLWFYNLIGCTAVLTNNPARTRCKLGR